MAAPVYRAGHGVARHVPVEPGQVAQILERLGIPLAHHVGGWVAVKHIHQLPGVAIGDAGLGGVRVVGHQGADLPAVGLQLFVIGQLLVPLHDGPGAVRRPLCLGRLTGAHHSVAVPPVCLGHLDADGEIAYLRPAAPDDPVIGPAVPQILPIQLIGAVCRQGGIHPVYIQGLLKPLIQLGHHRLLILPLRPQLLQAPAQGVQVGNADGGAAPVPAGNFCHLLPQHPVHLSVHPRQPAARLTCLDAVPSRLGRQGRPLKHSNCQCQRQQRGHHVFFHHALPFYAPFSIKTRFSPLYQTSGKITRAPRGAPPFPPLKIRLFCGIVDAL